MRQRTRATSPAGGWIRWGAILGTVVIVIGAGIWFLLPADAPPVLEEEIVQPAATTDDWQQVSAEDFQKRLATLTSQEPTAETGRLALEQLWDRFLASDEQTAKLPPATQLALIDSFQSNQDWLKQEDGSYVHGGPEVYAERIDAIRDRLQAQPSQASSESAVAPALNASFADFQQSWIDAALPTDPAQRQLALLRRADGTAAWLKQADRKKLSMAERAALLSSLTNSGLNREKFSVRWTGLIVPPVTGEYRLGPLLNNLTNGSYRIVIDGEAVFDTERTPLSATPDEPVLLGDAVLLSAENPARLLVEYRYDVDATTVEVPFQLLRSYRYPMMVLIWNSPSTGLQVVPETAFRLPANATASQRQGLWAQYFDKPDFGVPWAQGVTSGIEEVWVQAPIPPKAAELADLIIDDALDQLLTVPADGQPAENLLSILSAGKPLFPFMRLSQRQRVLDRVLALAPGFIDIPPSQLHAFMSQMAMLPGEARLKLLTAWAQYHISGSVKEIIPTGSQHLYNTINHYPYAFLGISLTGRHRPELDLLLEEGLEKPDGSPQLELIAIASYAMYLQNRGNEMRDWLVERLEGRKEDELAAWLMARGWMEEAFILEGCKEVQGIPYFEQAAEAAKDPGLRLDAIRELVVRETTIGQAKLALDRIDDALNEFKEPAQQEILNRLVENIKSMQPQIDKQAQTFAEQKAKAARAAQQQVLQSRMERAQARGDIRSAASYQKQLGQESK